MGYVYPPKESEPLKPYIVARGPAGVTINGNWGEAPASQPRAEPIASGLHRRIVLSGGDEWVFGPMQVMSFFLQVERVEETDNQWQLLVSTSADGRVWRNLACIREAVQEYRFDTPETVRFVRVVFEAVSCGMMQLVFASTN